MRSLLAATVFLCLSATAFGHDIYTGLREKMDPAGMLCCGDADCEPVEYQVLSNGDAIFTSTRHGGAQILIAKDKIGWFSIPGGEKREAHWCGYKREADPTAGQPDPHFYTYCAFIQAGGV